MDGKDNRQYQPSIKPTISVIVPLYNAAKYIAQCLDSVLAQSLPAMEIIVIDDCSVDGSCEIVTKRYGEEPRVCLVRNPHNMGVGATRNLGITLAQGEYLAFIDADDLFLPEALATLGKVAAETKADVIHLSGHYMTDKDTLDDDTGFIYTHRSNDVPVTDNVFLPDDLAERITDWLGGKINHMPWNKLFRREFLLLNRLFFPRIHNGEDTLFNFCCICAASRYVKIASEPIYVWRFNPRGNSRPLHRQSLRSLQQEIAGHFIGLKYLADFMENYPFFTAHEDLRYRVIDAYLHLSLYVITPALLCNPEKDFADAVRSALGTFAGNEYWRSQYVLFYLRQCNAFFAENQKLHEENQRLKAELSNFRTST